MDPGVNGQSKMAEDAPGWVISRHPAFLVRQTRSTVSYQSYIVGTAAVFEDIFNSDL